VVFLASDEASFITVHILNVDGGFGAAGVIFEPETIFEPEEAEGETIPHDRTTSTWRWAATSPARPTSTATCWG
jgi:hypothetical protein